MQAPILIFDLISLSSDNFNFAVQVDDSSIEVNSGNNKLDTSHLENLLVLC